VLAAYLIMNLQDSIIGLNAHDTELATGVIFFCLLSGLMLYKLQTQKA